MFSYGSSAPFAAPSSHARSDAGGWLVLGLIFGIFALLLVIGLPPKPRVFVEDASAATAVDGMKRCPNCGEAIQAVARQCRYCGMVFAAPISAARQYGPAIILLLAVAAIVLAQRHH